MKAPKFLTSAIYLYKALSPYLKVYKKELVWGFVFLTASNIGLIAFWWMLGWVGAGVSGEGGYLKGSSLALALTGVAALLFFCCYAKYTMRIFIISVSRKAERDLREVLFAHLQKLSPSFYDREKTGDIMSRTTNDISAVREALGPGVLYPLNFITMVPPALMVMFYMSWKLSLVILIPTVAIPFMVTSFTKRMHKHFKTVQKLLGEMSSMTQENFSGMRVIKSFVQEEPEKKVFDDLGEKYTQANLKLAYVRSSFFPFLILYSHLVVLITYTGGSVAVLRGWLTFGELSSFVLVQAQMMLPIVMLSWVLSVYEKARVGLNRIQKYLDVKPEVADLPRLESHSSIRGNIEIKNLKFTYSGLSGEILKGIDLKIYAGQKLGLTGPTACGKSTLLNLITRQYLCDSQKIFIDGIPLEDIPLEDLWESMAVVHQEPFIFSDTLENNIKFGRPDMGFEEAVRCANLADLAENIENFSDKYQTMVGEKGVTLSGGQKLRLAMARALARRSPILILDDAFSAVDVKTEETIMNNFNGEFKNQTMIIVSHRISTLKLTDRILVMEEGAIVQDGSHDQLKEQDGYYRKLLVEQDLLTQIDAID